MKRALKFAAVGAAVLIGLYAVAALGARRSWKRAGEARWPLALGTLEELPARYPAREANAAALRLAELARPLGIDFLARREAGDSLKAFTGFVNAECARDAVTIGEPPAAVVQFLAANEAAIDALAAHLDRSGEIAWATDLSKGSDAPMPYLAAHMQLSRVFVARALVRARGGDARAWDDLRAAYQIERAIRPRPELISQLVGLQLARVVNATAWKLPLSAPAWLAELHGVDRRRLILRGLQFDSWAAWHDGWGTLKSDPYFVLSLASFAELQRETAVQISRVTTCTFDGAAFAQQRADAIPRWNMPAQIATPNIARMWSRTIRFDAEREAAANALRVRAGAPVLAQSRCTDGTWRHEGGKLAFTAAIADDEPSMPVQMQVVADAR